jgi:hypothetical protein
MDALESSYVQRKGEYDTLLASPTPNVDAIKAKNLEISGILNEMLTELSKVKEDAGHIEQVRNDLVGKLVKVQNDYNVLVNQKDQVETLKTIRVHEDEKFYATFYWYGVGLLVVSVLFFFVLMWKGGYKAPTMPTMMISPITMAPFR